VQDASDVTEGTETPPEGTELLLVTIVTVTIR
jgi:hypothetical protein